MDHRRQASIGAFAMGFGIMTSVVTNNVSALAALAIWLLPLGDANRSGGESGSSEAMLRSAVRNTIEV